MELNKLPIIDWDLSIKLAGNKKDLAEDMLNMLVNNLSADITSIKTCYKLKDYQGLLKRVHRLHGALCYCGLPRLKSVINQLELDLKNNIYTNLAELFLELDHETQLVLKSHAPAKTQITD